MTSMKNEIYMTHHAERQSRQRVVPPLIIDWLYQYGELVHDGHSALLYHFNKAAKRKIRRSIGSACYSGFTNMMDCYLVDVDGKVITVGHRFKRIRRN